MGCNDELEMNEIEINNEEEIILSSIDLEDIVEIEKNSNDQLSEKIDDISKEIEGLKDLFLRRLLEDKQKSELIKILDKSTKFVLFEPFASDIILLLDRLDKVKDEFAQSVYEELYNIMHRRGLERIAVNEKFDPRFNKAVKVESSENTGDFKIINIIRHGYIFGDKVLRPAEVVVVRTANN